MGKKGSHLSLFICAVFAVELLFPQLSDEFRILLLFFTSVASLLFLIQFSPIHIPKRFTLIFGAFFLSKVVSSVAAGVLYQGILDLIFTVSVFLWIVVLVSVLHVEKRFLHRFMVLLAGITLYLSLAGILEYTGRSFASHSIPLLLPFEWSSLAAVFFAVMFPLLFVFYLTRIGGALSLFFALSLIFSATSWILSRTFVSILAGTSLILSFAYFRWFKDKGYRTFSTTVQNLFLLLATLFIIGPNLLSSFGIQLVPDVLAARLFSHYYYDRMSVIDFSLESIRTHPWWGIGSGAFGIEYQNHLNTPWVWSDHARNEFLETGVENGILGVLFETILFISIAAVLIKNLRSSIFTRDLFTLSLTLSLSLFLLSALFTDSFRTIPLSLLFYCLLAFLLTKESSITVHKQTVLLPLVVLLFVSFILIADTIILVQSKRAVVRNDSVSAKKFLSYLTLRPSFLINPKVYIWLSAYELNNQNNTRAISYLEQANSLTGFTPEGAYQLASLYYRGGEREKAKTILLDAIAANPYVPPKLYLALFDMYEEEKNLPRSLYWLKRASLFYPIDSHSNVPHISLSILSSLNYLSPLQIIYYSLYQRSSDSFYFDAASKLNF